LEKLSFKPALIGLAAPLALFSSFCFADLNEVTVTSTRSIRPVLDTLADVTVIDRSSIQNGAYASVIDLLQAQPGVEITQQGGQGKLSGLFLRGTKTAQTLILVDGVRLENQAAPIWNFYLFQLLKELKFLAVLRRLFTVLPPWGA
jgi:vitamin B12 transporter